MKYSLSFFSLGLFKRFFWRITITTVLALLIASCSTVSQKQQISGSVLNERNRIVSDLKPWQVEARMSVRRGKRQDSFNLFWHTNSDNTYQFKMTTFFGQIVFSGFGNDSVMQVENDGQVQEVNPGEYIEQELGLRIAPSDFQQIFLGLVPTEATELKVNNQQLAESFKLARFKVSYKSYQDTELLKMPRVMQLEQGKNLIKLVLFNWQLGIQQQLDSES